MAIPKQLVTGVFIGFLIGASLINAFTQYSSPTKDNQIAELQKKVTSLENFIIFNSQKSAGLPLAGAPSPSQNLTAKAVIQNVSVTLGGLLVWAQATASQDVTITAAWIQNTNGTIVARGNLLSTVLPRDGTLTSITGLLPNGALSSGSNYTLTLVSVQGESFVSPTFTFVTT
ncbi:MAG TPA: hypothetical protein VF893_04550 [Candidatus Bathyarchaeia archaeon]